MPILPEAAIQKYLATLEYRPGWTIEYYIGFWYGPHFRFQGDVPNTYRPQDPPIHIDVNRFPSPNDLASIETLDIYLGWHLRHIEIHEALEFFKEKGGRPIFDPHLEGCDRDLDAFPPTG
jgi:hypothetical protein